VTLIGEAWRGEKINLTGTELANLGALPPVTWLRFRNVGDIVSAVVVIGVLVVIVAWAQIAVSRRNRVLNSSSALGGLVQLNSFFAPAFSSYPRAHFDYNTRVNSKAKLDRYNLQAFMRTCLLESELQVASCIEARLQAEAQYDDYCKRYDELGRQNLGRSRSDRLDDAKYRSIEQKLYTKRRLRHPQSATLIRATVSYTSPQGRNSYTRRWDLTFEELQHEFTAARAVRSQQSTTAYLRQQERNRITAGVRSRVLAQDNYRCRHCGISADLGAVLHVDHIIPISKGGTSDPGNLQTLCLDCNLGKSNRVPPTQPTP
jgi:HNH endonuclease